MLSWQQKKKKPQTHDAQVSRYKANRSPRRRRRAFRHLGGDYPRSWTRKTRSLGKYRQERREARSLLRSEPRSQGQGKSSCTRQTLRFTLGGGGTEACRTLKGNPSRLICFDTLLERGRDQRLLKQMTICKTREKKAGST